MDFCKIWRKNDCRIFFYSWGPAVFLFLLHSQSQQLLKMLEWLIPFFDILGYFRTWKLWQHLRDLEGYGISYEWAGQKWLNRSRCCLWEKSREMCIRCGLDPLWEGRGTFEGDMWQIIVMYLWITACTRPLCTTFPAHCMWQTSVFFAIRGDRMLSNYGLLYVFIGD